MNRNAEHTTTVEVVDLSNDADEMVECIATAGKKKIRMVLTTSQVPGRLAPVKRARENESDDGTHGYEDVDAYKYWLEEKGPDTGVYIHVLFVLHIPRVNCNLSPNLRSRCWYFADLCDCCRYDTIKTYTEWLREKDLLEKIRKV